MIRKIWNALLSFKERLMKLVDSSVAIKVIIRLFRNILIFVAVLTGFVWVLIQFEFVRYVETLDPDLQDVAGGTVMVFVFVGVWWVFSNANKFRKKLKNIEGPSAWKRIGGKIWEITLLVYGIVSIISVTIFGTKFAIEGISNNWDNIVKVMYSIFIVIGGGAVGIIAIKIIKMSTSHNENASRLFIGIYILGAFFSIVLSFLTYGLSSLITLHGALSWLYIILFIKGV